MAAHAARRALVTRGGPALIALRHARRRVSMERANLPTGLVCATAATVVPTAPRRAHGVALAMAMAVALLQMHPATAIVATTVPTAPSTVATTSGGLAIGASVKKITTGQNALPTAWQVQPAGATAHAILRMGHAAVILLNRATMVQGAVRLVAHIRSVEPTLVCAPTTISVRLASALARRLATDMGTVTARARRAIATRATLVQTAQPTAQRLRVRTMVPVTNTGSVHVMLGTRDRHADRCTNVRLLAHAAGIVITTVSAIRVAMFAKEEARTRATRGHRPEVTVTVLSAPLPHRRTMEPRPVRLRLRFVTVAIRCTRHQARCFDRI